MRNALVYLTYNGVYNFTNGIGTQTQLLLSGLERIKPELESLHGPIDVHIVCPQPDAHTWGYDAGLLRQQSRRINALGGKLHYIPYASQPGQELWEIRSWQTLSAGVIPVLHQLAPYDRVLLLCIDQPWLHLPRTLETFTSGHHQRLHTLLVLYNTAFIRNWNTPDDDEIAWEQEGLSQAQAGSAVAIADICPSFTAHLIHHFGVSTTQFAPYTSSILTQDPLFALQSDTAIQALLQSYGIPVDTNLVFAFGRAAPIKGFERLIPALAPIREQIHFVLISVPYGDDNAQQRRYDRLLAEHGIQATHIKHFTRELPRALCQWQRTTMVVLPSQQETFSNIPLEVALWARDTGPVVVTSTVGGFADQIQDGMTGFVLDITSPSHMAQTLQRVLQLPRDQHTAIRRNAYHRVLRQYDFTRNFPETLQWFWGATPACSR